MIRPSILSERRWCDPCAYPRNADWGTEFQDLKLSSLNENIGMQLGGSLVLAQVALNHFNQMVGHLILVSSIQFCAPKFDHYSGTKMVSPIEYSAVKAGLINSVRWLAKYYANKNIRVNCNSPGGILDQQPSHFLNGIRAVQFRNVIASASGTANCILAFIMLICYKWPKYCC